MGYLQDAAVQADSMAWQIETADLINVWPCLRWKLQRFVSCWTP